MLHYEYNKTMKVVNSGSFEARKLIQSQNLRCALRILWLFTCKGIFEKKKITKAKDLTVV